MAIATRTGSKRRRLVVKIGTNTLAGPQGAPDPDYLADVAHQVATLRGAGHDVLLVTSGAIGAGKALLGHRGHVADVRLRQAYASVGQARLMRAWEAAFARHDVLVAQLLLTHDTFTRRKSFLNLRNATEALLGMGVVPIVNENDAISVDEIDQTFGDNDRLCAMVAAKAGADLLVILSDVAGLYSAPPGRPGATLIPVVDDVRPELYDHVTGRPGSGRGRGGMRSKLDAARTATRAGIPVVVADGREPRVIERVAAGDPLGTTFLPHGQGSRKDQWLRMARAAGRVHVDAGAADALGRGKHLLPAGVVRIEGNFPAETVIEILHDERVVAKAVTELGSRDLERAMGRRSTDLVGVLGRPGPFNVTRKKNLTLVVGGAA